MKTITFRVLCTFLVLTSFSVSAQDYETMFDFKVQVGSAEEENLFNAPSTVSIIDRDMIRDYNFTSVSEAVQTIAGMAVMRTYLKRNLPTSRGILQDHYANKVLILVNGVPSWNAVTGEGNLDRIDINDIERIEVLKGPASVLYGTNAYSGAVNVVLKESAEGQLNSYVGFGTNGSFRSGANYSGSDGDFSYFVSGNSSNIIQKEYAFKGEDGNEALMREGIRTDNFTMQTKYKAHTLLFNGFNSTESYLGVTPKFSGGAGNDHLIKGYVMNYGFDQDVNDDLNLRFGLNYDYGNRNLSRTLDDVIRANIEGYRMNGYFRAGYQISDAFHFEAGGSYDYRKSIEYKNYDKHQDTLVPRSWTSNVDTTKTIMLDGNNGMNDKTVSEYSVYGQLKFVKDKFRALLGSRYTSNELFGSDVSSRVSLAYAFNEQNSLKLIYGESFRSPSLFEQYFTYTTVLGNQELKPEKSKSAELVYMTGMGNFFAQALVYYAIYDNKIVRQRGDAIVGDDFPVSNISIYQNGESFTATGVEVELKYANPKVINTFLNVNYVMGDEGDKDESENFNFKYVPEISASFGISKTIAEKVSISALLNYWSETTGAIKDENGDFLTVDAQTSLDMNISYQHKIGKASIRHSIAAKNLLDTDILYPEYVRRSTLNTVTSGYFRTILYTVSVSL
jgi:outer membrane receptor protein involved in Fe transport